MKMKLRTFAASLASALALVAGPAFAHGESPHLMGTVKSVQQNTLTVETTQNQAVSVQLTPQTRYEKGQAAAGPKDLTPGERVVVHTRRSGNALTAVEVQLPASAPGR